VPVTFQIWDVTRLKRIHSALSVRDDLVVDFSHIEGGGLRVLPASVRSGEYEGYLAVIPGEDLANIYMQHGSRLLEGNVRTFLGRSGKVNKGIAATVAKEPAKFFAYNNGIAATASEVTSKWKGDGSIVVTSATDLQIVNGAQTTASLASAARDKTLTKGTIFVPMKLSVVAPSVASDLIPAISRCANSQNGVRPSDFFANHPFHRLIEGISRRILAPAVGGSQVQTARRAAFGDEWLRAAVARVILFRAAEASVSKAAWYDGGYRAQIVAYTCARVAKLAIDQEGSGGLDYIKVWAQQSPGEVLEQQIATVSEAMADVLKNPPLAGQNISEWAKQQGCRKVALQTAVPAVKGFDDCFVTNDDIRAIKRSQRTTGRIDRGLDALNLVLSRGSNYWESLRGFCRTKRILLPEDEKALVPACQIPSMVPSDKQAARLLQLADRAVEAGWQFK
jgi:hypothetical protein